MICPECGDEYKRIGSHWGHKQDHKPDISNEQFEIAVGFLMGDGWVNGGNKNPFVAVEMVSKDYLKYIDNKFDVLSNGVSLYRTAEENAKRSRDSGFRPNAKAENYSDTYRWKSRTHRQLKPLANWYETGEKVFPKDIKLTSTVLKHWYCCDGNWNNSNSNNYIRIGMENEIENKSKIDAMFTLSGLPKPSNYANTNIEFTVSQSKELWDYMGEPLPDFGYKWPEQYH